VGVQREPEERFVAHGMGGSRSDEQDNRENG
jgi:hypothetical protein